MARWAWLLVALTVLATSIWIVTPSGTATDPVLVVHTDTGEEILTVPVAEGTTVTIAYTHSVERTPVADIYTVKNDALVMQQMEFRSFGAGLPSTVSVTQHGDKYVYQPPERAYNPLRITTGPIADHDLLIGDDRYDLSTIADGGTVELHIERRLGL